MSSKKHGYGFAQFHIDAIEDELKNENRHRMDNENVHDSDYQKERRDLGLCSTSFVKNRVRDYERMSLDLLDSSRSCSIEPSSPDVLTENKEVKRHSSSSNATKSSSYVSFMSNVESDSEITKSIMPASKSTSNEFNGNAEQSECSLGGPFEWRDYSDYYGLEEEEIDLDLELPDYDGNEDDSDSDEALDGSDLLPDTIRSGHLSQRSILFKPVLASIKEDSEDNSDANLMYMENMEGESTESDK